MDENVEFNFSGKIPTDSKFWDIGADKFVTDNGITPNFSRVIAEQVYMPVKTLATPFYNRFAGIASLNEGMGWTERVVKKTAGKKFNPKASAEDALKFYDNSGYEWHYTKNIEGWRPTTLPSNLKTAEMMLKSGSIGRLNDILVENVKQGYLRDMDSAIALKAISTTKNETTVDVKNLDAVRKKIRDIAVEMRGNSVHYNELTEAINKEIYTNSDKVLCFMDEKLWNDIRDSYASLPSPEKVVENVEIVPCVDGLPKPITTTEYNAGSGVVTWDGTKPSAIDKDKPAIWMCSAKRIEYRPYIGEYRINVQRNGAGDFENQHLIWSGCLAVRPYENAIRINPTA